VIAIAASFGLPVIATRTGGVPEQINDGVTGILVTPGSVVELVDAVEDLLNNAQKAALLGQSLAKDFSMNRNWNVIATQVLSACEKAMITY
jgi:glycosyltransferase involved in cell wall biosynthesis